MGKKSKAKQEDKQLAGRISESAREIWLAGLGVYTRAEDEGRATFDALVEEGRQVEKRLRKRVSDRLENIRGQAGGSWEQVEQIFESRLQEAMARLGVPSRTEVKALEQRVAELRQRLAELQGAASPAPAAAEPEGTGDDLTRINGIGAVLARRLNEHGVYRYSQIASWTDAEIDALETTVLTGRMAGRARRYDWVGQARALMGQPPSAAD